MKGGGPSAAPLDVNAALSQLLGSVRAGVLLTMTEDGPSGSHVPFLIGSDWTIFYVHLSALAQHTQNLQKDTRVALFVGEPDSPEKNPLSLRRVNFMGRADPLARESERYAEIQSQYVAKYKQSAMMFSLADFQLWELSMNSAHLVAGFGQAYRSFRGGPREWVHQRA
jgi:putative heme iron utilization protein